MRTLGAVICTQREPRRRLTTNPVASARPCVIVPSKSLPNIQTALQWNRRVPVLVQLPNRAHDAADARVELDERIRVLALR
jgi:hypothetical protein